MMADRVQRTPADGREPGDRRLRLLLITDKVPTLDNGYGIRVHNVLAGLRMAGDVTICLIDSSDTGVVWPHDDDDDDVSPVVVRAHNQPRWRRVLALIGLSPGNVRYADESGLRTQIAEAVGLDVWDMVWCSRARVHMLTSTLDLGTRVVDLDDLNEDLLRTRIRDRNAVHGRLVSLPRNVHYALEAWRWRRVQRSIVDSVDCVAVCSREDAARIAAPTVHVVPNGYPRADRVGHDVSARPDRMLMVGSLDYEPNLLAAEWFIHKVLPLVRQRLPTAELVVVGACTGHVAAQLAAPGVTLTGHVADVGGYYRNAALAVVPLHSGAGTRLKVLEALAREVPLVSTSFGVRGHALEAGTDFIVADEPDAFASACVAVLTDADLSQRLVDNGRRRFDATLSSEITTRAVQVAIAAGRRSAPSGGRR